MTTVLQVVRPVILPAGAARDYTLLVEDVSFDDNGNVTSRAPADLTGAFLCWALTNPDTGKTLVEKNSLTVTQIEILADQSVGSDERGRAVLKLVRDDTSDLDVGDYTHAAWVELADGRKDTVVDVSPFFLADPGKEFPAGSPAPIVGTPAPQTQQERNFEFTLPADTVGPDHQFTVTIPGAGMLRDTYSIFASFTDVPTNGAIALLRFPSSGRAAASFLVEASGLLLQNTVIEFYLRDRA